MEKKAFLETMRKSLELKMQYYNSKITVKCSTQCPKLYVVFPPETQFISYVVVEEINMAGGNMAIRYFDNHIEVVIDVLYIE